MDEKNALSELERVRRVSDMLCTGHSYLRDRYSRLALAGDATVLAASTWLLALTFVEPSINVVLTPFGIDPRLWLGSLSAIVFFATVWQMKADWKGRADAHRRSCDMYAEVHRECGYILAQGEPIAIADCRKVLSRFDMATDVGTPIPEKYFLKLKRKHKLKILISKVLDDHPGTWPRLMRVIQICRDNSMVFRVKND